jgi:hypothetical protein
MAPEALITFVRNDGGSKLDASVPEGETQASGARQKDFKSTAADQLIGSAAPKRPDLLDQAYGECE